MRKLQFCLAISVLLLVSSLSAIAQVQNGQFTGVVTDPSGAALANASVTVTNTATNFAVAATTNQTGIYVVKELPPGPYKITV
ncbi:MAG TPA: carboxypeptidase-like regulatory domain-containing protein, partial [Terriglobales bacterium]|nr:carboxypeptidase-like regulatory domain-containing protein [Terriglobales bacterium]